MALLENLGTAVKNGASIDSETIGTDLDAYIVESATEGGATVDSEDVVDANGARVSRLIFNRQKQIQMTLISKTVTYANIVIAFPQGDMCSVTSLTSYFVTSCAISKVKGAWKIAVTLDKIFTNA